MPLPNPRFPQPSSLVLCAFGPESQVPGQKLFGHHFFKFARFSPLIFASLSDKKGKGAREVAKPAKREW